MIKILDKVNNTCKKVKDDIDMVIHPLNKETIFLKDMALDNQIITGVIFKKDGTTLILYKKRKWINKWIQKLKYWKRSENYV